MRKRRTTGSRLDELEPREEPGGGPKRATVGGIRVEEVVAAWVARPAIESVREAFPALTREQVIAALEHHQEHWAEISAGLGDEARERRRAEATAEKRAVAVGRGDPAVVAAVTITKRPGVCGGRACIDDTRIRVIDLVQLQREGRRPEEMADAFAASLTMAQVHLGLQYAARYPAEVEADFAAHEAAEEESLRYRAQFFAERGIPDPSAESGP
jgi:uncharacterized protein (DUF433 family)